MIKVVARCTVKPGKAAEYKSLAARLTEETRKEKGCVSYALYQDVDSELAFSFIEEWSDREALDAHMKTKHFTEIVPQLNALKEDGSSMHVYRSVE